MFSKKTFRKMIGSTAAAAVLALSAGAAFAEVQKFELFSIDVPEGWTVMNEGDGTVGFVEPNKEASFSIAVTDAEEGVSAAEMAKQVSEQLGGTEPKEAGEGVVEFTFSNQEGVESTCRSYVEQGKFVMITITDANGTHQETIGAALATVEDAK